MQLLMLYWCFTDALRMQQAVDPTTGQALERALLMLPWCFTDALLMQQVVDPTTGQAVAALNELEFVHGEIFANIWFTDRCVPILNPIVK